jgi:hypothetical protein
LAVIDGYLAPGPAEHLENLPGGRYFGEHNDDANKSRQTYRRLAIITSAKLAAHEASGVIG